MTVQTLPDITSTGSAQQVTTSGMEAKWIAFGASGGSVRIGDSSVGSARGVQIASGGVLVLPLHPEHGERYRPSQIWAYLGSGATLTISYGGV